MAGRARIVQAIRDFFVARGFLEVETPILAPFAGQEPHLSPLKTMLHDARNGKHSAHLITSPEYACKKLLAAGYEKIFTITKCFRDAEPWGDFHNPEFTMLEWYRAHADYRAIMKDVEDLIYSVARQVQTKSQIPNPNDQTIPNFQYPISNIQYQTHTIDLTPPWPRLSVREAFKKYCGLELDRLLTRNGMAKAVSSRGYTVSRTDTFDDLFFKIFLTEIEPRLGNLQPTTYNLQPHKPVILYDYPVQMASLARKKSGDPRYAERFEVYVAGREIANAFSELNDQKEQMVRLKAEQRLRRKLGREVYPIDKSFIEAVGRMPPSAGIALGVDRLIMLLLDARDINEVVLFGAENLFSAQQYGKH